MTYLFKNAALRLLAAALALCLFFCAGSAVAEVSRNASFWMRAEGENALYAQSMASAGDALYLLATDNALYRYRAGDAEPQKVFEGLNTSHWVSEEEAAEDQINASHLFSLDGALYGLGLGTGEVTRLTDENGEVNPHLVCTLDKSLLNQEDIYVSQVFGGEGKLCVLTEGRSSTLFVYALTDGAQPEQLAVENGTSLTAYRNGLLAWVTRPYEDENTQEAKVISYDPATGTQETLFSTGIADYAFGLSYSPDTDTFYVGMDSRVYAYSAPEWKSRTAAYLPERGTDLQLIGMEGLIAARASSGVYIRDGAQGDMSDQVVTVEGEYGSEAHMAVVREHPEMVVSPSSNYTSDLQTLTASMVSGESAMDVLKLSPEYQPVEGLINKGYAADLSAYPEIMAVADQMDPRFLEPFQRDGKLYALPVNAYAQTVSVNRVAWTEELGLSLDELPKTYMELLDFVSNFSYDYGEDHPELTLTDSWDLRAELLTMLLQGECVYQMREGEERFTFDTPRFHKLVAALDAIDYSDISLKEILGMDASDDDYNEFYSKAQLFSLYYSAGPGSYKDSNTMFPLPLALEDGLEPVVPASLSVLLINPKSAHPDLAAAYVASYASHLEAATDGVTLFPDRNDEVLNPYFEQSLQDAKQWLEERQKALEAAAPENKAALTEEVDAAKHWVEAAEKDRLLLTKEEIAAFRENIGRYLMPLSSGAAIAIGGGETDASVRTLLEQYAQRAIDGDAFIRELDNRVRLKQLENQ